jgi:hypothetical protein
MMPQIEIVPTSSIGRFWQADADNDIDSQAAPIRGAICAIARTPISVIMETRASGDAISMPHGQGGCPASRTGTRRNVMPQRRTTHRSSKGTKLYAVRDSDGTFKDIQTYKRAHAADLRASAKGETAAKSKTAVAKKAAKKVTKQATSTASRLVAKAKKAVKRAVRKVTP